MKKLFLALVLVLIALPAWAVTSVQVVFSIASTAATATPNLRIMQMKGGVKIQGMSTGPIANYYLTKSQTFQLEGMDAILIQADQNTKMFTNSDATNYILIYSGVDSTFTVQK